MKLKKLKLDDFKAVDTQDLMEIRGAQGGYGGCQGDDNGFGGTFDMDEVTVYGSDQTDGNCPTCNHLHHNQIAQPRSTYTPLGAWLLYNFSSHTSGCDGNYSNNSYSN